MKKYLVTIEFRYVKRLEYDETNYITKTNTIGVFDTIEEARTEGNKQLEVLESIFPLNPNWNNKERFKQGQTLISNLAYLITPFSFFAKITYLNYSDLRADIDQVLIDIKPPKDK